MNVTLMEKWQRPLHIVAEASPPVLVIRLEGELDFSCDELVRGVPANGWGEITTVVVDLLSLDFSDTPGLRALLDLQEAHRSLGREVQIVNACPLVQRLSLLLAQQISMVA